MNRFTDYQINTGEMYTELTYQEENFSKDLIHEFELYLERIHSRRPLDRNPDFFMELPANDDYTLQKLNEYSYNISHWKTNARPFKWFFMIPINRAGDYALIDFTKPYIINKEIDEEYFDYFFVVRMILTNIMTLREFLNFQLHENFQDDPDSFRMFLSDLLIKYDQLFTNTQHITFLSRFIENEIGKKFVIDENGIGDQPTMAITVMAWHYILKAIDPKKRYNQRAQARFIQTLTGFNLDNIYKMVQNPLSTRQGNNRMDELAQVLKMYQELDLPQVIQLILADMGS